MRNDQLKTHEGLHRLVKSLYSCHHHQTNQGISMRLAIRHMHRYITMVRYLSEQTSMFEHRPYQHRQFTASLLDSRKKRDLSGTMMSIDPNGQLHMPQMPIHRIEVRVRSMQIQRPRSSERNNEGSEESQNQHGRE